MELDTAQGRLRLGVGKFVGAGADSDTPARNDAALALGRVKTLVVSRIDLFHLVARRPELANRFEPSAQARRSAPGKRIPGLARRRNGARAVVRIALRH